MARFELRTTRELARFIAAKGSVTLDGVSLTVNTVDDVAVFGADHSAHAQCHDARRLARRQRGQSRGRPDGALRRAAVGNEVGGSRQMWHTRRLTRVSILLTRWIAGSSPGNDVPILDDTKMADARRAPLKDQTDISGARALIVEARFYDDIQDALLEGAVAELKAAGVSHDVITVPGALEIPAAIAIALDAAESQRQALRRRDRARLRDPGRHHPFRDRLDGILARADGPRGGADRFRSATASSPSTPTRRPGRGRAPANSTRAATPRARRSPCCGSSAG